MPCNHADYHPDWKSIVRQIKEQAGDRCEFCGAPNRAWVTRDASGRWTIDETIPENTAVIAWGWNKPTTPPPTKIVLTVAHLDHDVGNNDPANLKALCQKCHLAWDRDHHNRNAAETRRRKKIAAGQAVLV